MRVAGARGAVAQRARTAAGGGVLGGPVDGRSVHALVGADAGQRAVPARARALRRRARHAGRGRRGLALAGRDGGRPAADGARRRAPGGARPGDARGARGRRGRRAAGGGLLEADETAAARGARAPGARRAARRRAAPVGRRRASAARRGRARGASGTRREAILRRLADAIEAAGRTAAHGRGAGGRLAPRLRRRGDPELFERAAGQALAALDYPLAERFARAALDCGRRASARGSRSGGRSPGPAARTRPRRCWPLEQRRGADDERAAVAVARARNVFWGADRAGDAERRAGRAEAAVADRGVRDGWPRCGSGWWPRRGDPREALAAAGRCSQDAARERAGAAARRRRHGRRR